MSTGDRAGSSPGVAGAAPSSREVRLREIAALLSPLRSVRVRITLAATAATAVAVFSAAWLLIQAVEDTQLTNLRAQGGADLAALEADLASGATPQVESLDSTFELPLLMIESEGFMPIYPEARLRVHVGEGGVVDAAEVWGIDLDGAQGGLRYDEPGDVRDETDSSPAEGVPWYDETVVDDRSRYDEPVRGDPYGLGAWHDYLLADEGETGEEYGSDPIQQFEEAYERYVWQEQVDAAAVVERLDQAQGGSYEIVTRTVNLPSGEATLVGALPTDGVARSLDAVRRPLMLGLPLLVGLVALATWLLVGRALRPVELIRTEAERIEGATIHRRLPEPETGDEVGRLARTMNAMLDRLDRSSRRQRQFVSDASHELRSPVAAIRTDLEVALHEGERADWPRVARDVLAEEARLEGLLDDLLLLATDDERNSSSQVTGYGEVDLTVLVADEAERSHRVPVTVVRDQHVVTHCSARLLTRLVRNLLDNAARHASSQVEVSVVNRSGGEPGQASGRVRITVDDDGPGIPLADRERVFERFIRLDEGRARDQGGAGLGLAVVAAIAQRHGGEVWVEDSPLGGARFVVEIAGTPPVA